MLRQCTKLNKIKTAFVDWKQMTDKILRNSFINLYELSLKTYLLAAWDFTLKWYTTKTYQSSSLQND